jgi:hypothetical protein
MCCLPRGEYLESSLTLDTKMTCLLLIRTLDPAQTGPTGWWIEEDTL